MYFIVVVFLVAIKRLNLLPESFISETAIVTMGIPFLKVQK